MYILWHIHGSRNQSQPRGSERNISHALAALPKIATSTPISSTDIIGGTNSIKKKQNPTCEQS